MDCICHYNPPKGCGALALIADWKWKPPLLYLSKTRHPSGAGCVWGSEKGVADAKSELLSDWPKLKRYFVRLWWVTAAHRDRPRRLCAGFAGRCWDQNICFLQPSGMWSDEEHLAACVLASLHVDLYSTTVCFWSPRALPPLHCGVINPIHRIAKTTVFQMGEHHNVCLC